MKSPLAIALVICALLPGCSWDRDVSLEPHAPLAPTRDKITVWFDIERGDTSGTQQLALHLNSPTLSIGGYQGVIRYDAAAFKFVSAAKSDGDYAAVNPQASRPGTLGFAGFSAMGLHDAVIVRLVVRPHRKLTSADVTPAFDVVGTEEGRRVPRSSVVVSNRPFTVR